MQADYRNKNGVRIRDMQATYRKDNADRIRETQALYRKKDLCRIHEVQAAYRERTRAHLTASDEQGVSSQASLHAKSEGVRRSARLSAYKRKIGCKKSTDAPRCTIRAVDPLTSITESEDDDEGMLLRPPSCEPC